MDALRRHRQLVSDEAVTTPIARWAPVALFIYKRPEHARRMMSSLQACIGFAESPIYVFADGPAHPRDVPAVQETRAVAHTLLGEGAVFLERDANLGVDRSVIAGVTQLSDRFGHVVVVEDDLVVSPRFLEFLNRGLRHYADESRVMQVSGHMFDVPELRHQNEAIFLPMTTSWGWATWKRAWDLFDPAATGWQAHLDDREVRRSFDLDDHFAYGAMLARQMREEVGAWDIRWYYSVFERAGLGLFPPRTLVTNTGFDGSGAHDRLGLPAHQAPLETEATFGLPVEIAESDQKEHVFDAVGAFRPSSNRRKALALLRALLGRRGIS